MARIQQIKVDEATGMLRRLLEGAISRAGRVWNVTQVMSINPEAMRDSMRLYSTLMYGDSTLSRRQREMLAAVSSSEVGCHY